jgi:diguanylate cyclase (GGDEF)-like protein
MDPQQVLFTILVIVVIANIVLILLALFLAARRRRQARVVPVPVAAPSTAPSFRTAGFGVPGAPRTIEPAPGAGNFTDALTGLLLPVPFARVVADEDARIQRYRRPATIVMVEVEGLDRLVERLGETAIDRLIPAVADSIRRNAREADQVARLGPGRFAVLLPETDEVQAINYVERVRNACDLWLESGAVALRLAIGWASASETSLADAQILATDRMYAETRRDANRQDPEIGGPTIGMEPAFGS